MKKLRDPRLGKRPRIKKAILKEITEGENFSKDFKRVIYPNNQEPKDQVKHAGQKIRRHSSAI
jgi:hypothetical protein